MNEESLKQINTNLRHLLLVMTLGTLPEETKYSSLKKLGYTATEISELTGIPASTIKDRWNPKPKDGRNGKSK